MSERRDALDGDWPDTLDGGAWPEPPRPRDEVTARIREVCTRDIAPARRLSARFRLVASLALSAAVFLVLFLLSSAWAKPEGALRAALFGAAGWGAVMVVVLLVGLVRPPGRRGPLSLRVGLLLGLPVAFLVYQLGIGVAAPWGEFVTTGTGHALTCGLGAMLFGAITSLGVLWLWRGTDPLTPRVSGALAGLVGGMTSAIAIGTACRSGETHHLCLSHGAVVVAFVVVGALGGKRWLAP